MSDEKKKCFVIMPITTPQTIISDYSNQIDHFSHVYQHLFVPAIEKAGFEPISPEVTGSDIIHAEIIRNLSSADIVLCDMSILNPNVFFEFGIRSALDKPIALVVDDVTKNIPFDASIINYLRYKSSIDIGELSEEIDSLATHIEKTYKKRVLPMCY